MTIARLTSHEPITVSPDASVRTAAGQMEAKDVGMLVVVDAEERPVGIVTDRDLVLRCLAKGLDPARTTVDAVMSREPVLIAQDASVGDAIALMRHGNFRRLLVVGKDGRLAGIATLDDVMQLLCRELSDIGLFLESQTIYRQP